MIQKYAFTTAAMAAALEDTPISYEDLAEIEKDFDDAETEISTCSWCSCSVLFRLLSCSLFAGAPRRVILFGYLTQLCGHTATPATFYIEERRNTLLLFLLIDHFCLQSANK